MSGSADKTRWGILGPGRIAGQFAQAFEAVGNAELVACGSRSKGRAEEFGKAHGIERTYGSYVELVEDPEVDVVYVATPHSRHLDTAMLCLERGKAVLCEKPLTVNGAQAKELTRYARERGVFLMEAMWTLCHPAIRKVREWLDEGRVGRVRMLKADCAFSGSFEPGARHVDPALAGGALLDMGVYTIALAGLVFGALPERVATVPWMGPTGVDEQSTTVLQYAGGPTAVLSSGIALALPFPAHIVGEKGRIEIPFRFQRAEEAILHPAAGETERFYRPHRKNGYEWEIEETCRCLAEGRIESDIVSHEATIRNLTVMDRIRESWGLRYPFEEIQR